MRRVAAAFTILAVAACGQAQQVPLGPGRPWRQAYDGYGHVSATTEQGVVRLTLEPAAPESPAATHAALVLSRRVWRDFTAEVRVRTNHQLREPHPNAWEVGWLVWHYQDDEHFYYVVLKPNGWELGKADPRFPGGQRFLATGTNPRFPPGRWYGARIHQQGNVIQVNVDGTPLVRFTDTQRPYGSGHFGLYVEDASATFQPIAFDPPQ